MDLDRAQEIVRAINDRCLFAMGIVDKVGSIDGVTLAEMIEAKAEVEAENQRREDYVKAHGGSCSISLVPADRLIAAAFALENFDLDGDPLVASPYSGWRGNVRLLAVVAQKTAEEDDDE